MVAGNPFRRNFTGGFDQEAIRYACLGAGQDETTGFPNYQCPGGLRAQVYFPSCWDGKNLDSPDHTSHMSYPASGEYDNGPCPDTHPVQLVSLFFEVLYDTPRFADQWYGDSQPFVLAQGDATGYGFHGDFVNGWDVDVLQEVVDTCNIPAGYGSIDPQYCSAVTQYTKEEMNACRVTPLVDEQVRGLLPQLPGCNPVTDGPDAASQTICAATDLTTASVMNAKYFKDLRSTGYAFRGCAPDLVDGSTRTLSEATSMYSDSDVGQNMTIENCIAFCDGYRYAGVEYGTQCFCGDSLAEGVRGSADTAECQMQCAGDSSEYCGGSDALSVYKRCSGACTNKVLSKRGAEWIEEEEEVMAAEVKREAMFMVEPAKRLPEGFGARHVHARAHARSLGL